MMSRLSTAVLAAYTASMTLMAGWLGCQSFIVRRLLSFMMGISPESRLTYREILDRSAASQFLVDPVSVGVLYFGGIGPASIAVISLVILFGCLGLCSLRRLKEVPGSISEKD